MTLDERGGLQVTGFGENFATFPEIEPSAECGIPGRSGASVFSRSVSLGERLGEPLRGLGPTLGGERLDIRSVGRALEIKRPRGGDREEKQPANQEGFHHSGILPSAVGLRKSDAPQIVSQRGDHPISKRITSCNFQS